MDASAVAAAIASAVAAERERSEAAFADVLARLALAEARADSGSDGGGAAAVPVLRRFPRGVTSALAVGASPLTISSLPSKSGALALAPFASFDCGARPLAPELYALSAARSLAALAPDAPLYEVAMYPHATAHVPPWVESTTRAALKSKGSLAASTLFLDSAAPYPTIPGVAVGWACVPELLTVAERFHPAFNGEVKSAMSGGESTSHLTMFVELETYLLLGMLGSYFRGVPPGSHRFFRAPPRAYGLAAIAHVGYLVAAEWVGKALLSVVSQPFFIASPEHAAAVARLPDADASSDFVDVRVDGITVESWAPSSSANARVLWRVEPPARDSAPADAYFWKLLRGDGFEAPYLRSVVAVYAALAAARASGAADDPPPASLVDAELLFGAGELCVRMPWVHGRDASPEELSAGGAAVAPVAAAVAWLARHGLLYVDVRAPNVRVDEGGRVRLVDYDDCVVLGAPAADAGALRDALRVHNARWAASADTPGALPGVVDALGDAWLRRGV
jgi:hypothetical protein